MTAHNEMVDLAPGDGGCCGGEEPTLGDVYADKEASLYEAADAFGKRPLGMSMAAIGLEKNLLDAAVEFANARQAFGRGDKDVPEYARYSAADEFAHARRVKPEYAAPLEVGTDTPLDLPSVIRLAGEQADTTKRALSHLHRRVSVQADASEARGNLLEERIDDVKSAMDAGDQILGRRVSANETRIDDLVAARAIDLEGRGRMDERIKALEARIHHEHTAPGQKVYLPNPTDSPSRRELKDVGE